MRTTLVWEFIKELPKGLPIVVPPEILIAATKDHFRNQPILPLAMQVQAIAGYIPSLAYVTVKSMSRITPNAPIEICIGENDCIVVKQHQEICTAISWEKSALRPPVEVNAIKDIKILDSKQLDEVLPHGPEARVIGSLNIHPESATGWFHETQELTVGAACELAAQTAAAWILDTEKSMTDGGDIIVMFKSLEFQLYPGELTETEAKAVHCHLKLAPPAPRQKASEKTFEFVVMDFETGKLLMIGKLTGKVTRGLTRLEKSNTASSQPT